MASASTLPVSRVSSVLIVGAGLAGLRAAQALRTRGFTGRITVIGAELHAPYDRPPLSKHLFDNESPVFLSDDIGADLFSLADDTLLGTVATSIEVTSAGFRVALADAEGLPSSGASAGGDGPESSSGPREVCAQAVVLAVGSSPRSIPGWEGVTTLYTWDDAVHLRSALAPGSRLVIVGAGWVGSEIASVASAAGIHVTVVEATAAPLTTQLGPAVAEWLLEAWGSSEIQLLTGENVTGITKVDGHLSVATAGRGTLAADVVLSAIGARPNTAWLPDWVLRGPSGAVITSETGLAKTISDVAFPLFAAGDCAVRDDQIHGEIPGGHWNTALNDPERIALALTGGDVALPPHTPHVFSTQFGCELNLFGLPDVAEDRVVFRDYGDGSWTALYFSGLAGGGSDATAEQTSESESAVGSSLDGDRVSVTGIFTCNAPRDAAQARRLLASGPVLLNAAKAADPSVPLKLARA